MSLKTNINFIKEFNSLDNILKDMYDSDVPSKLGVTRYLETMKENEYQGSILVANWNSIYRDLKDLRNARNEAVHGDIEAILFDNEDIEWIINFKSHILCGSDPIAKLRKAKQSRKITQSKFKNTVPYIPTSTPSGKANNKSKVLLGTVIVLFILFYIFLYRLFI